MTACFIHRRQKTEIVHRHVIPSDAEASTPCLFMLPDVAPSGWTGEFETPRVLAIFLHPRCPCLQRAGNNPSLTRRSLLKVVSEHGCGHFTVGKPIQVVQAARVYGR